MIEKDLYTYITDAYQEDLEPISSLSKSTNGDILVNDNRYLYNFDKITEKAYNHIKTPSSADSLLVTDKIVLLTEFKSGFKRRISRETIDYSKLTCPDDATKVCKDYGKLLIQKGKLETGELLDSIKFKAIESYVTLEKKLFPLCSTLSHNNKLRIIFCVVIDDYVDSMEDSLLELANESSSSNTFTNIKSSLSRFVNIKTHDNEDFYYDEIKVLSPYEYQQYLSLYIA